MAERICSIDGCDRTVHCRGWCTMHYSRWQAHGDPHTLVRKKGRVCSVDDCDEPLRAQGLCSKHYQRWRKDGNPFGDELPDTPARRVWANIERDHSTGCWQWTGTLGRNGYGKLKVEGVTLTAHRYSYETFVGPIPDGLVIDHLCRNHACVNPDHLEPVTNRENLLRGVNYERMTARTHCKAEHEWTPENTRYNKRTGTRECRACAAEWQRQWRRRHGGAVWSGNVRDDGQVIGP